MNSIAEEALLGPCFKRQGVDITFWNEPSCLRPSGFPVSPGNEFFQAYSSAEKQLLGLTKKDGPVHLIAHSFGAHFAVLLARNNPKALASLHFVCPGLALFSAFKNIMRIALSDFNNSALEKSLVIEECLTRTQCFGDEWFIKGLACALEDPLLLARYWVRETSFKQWLAVVASDSRAAFDFDSFFGILKTLTFSHLQNSLLNFPRTCFYFADKDPVIDVISEVQLAKTIFYTIKTVSMKHCGHFAHLEDSESFVRLILENSVTDEEKTGLRTAPLQATDPLSEGRFG